MKSSGVSITSALLALRDRKASSIKLTGFATLLFALMLPTMSYAKEYSLYGRDIGCAELDPGRSRQICDAIAASLTWQWMGHAIIAPGYKPDFESISKVYCELRIGKDDVKVLQKLQRYDPDKDRVPDWRLESGAYDLQQLVDYPSRLKNQCQ